MDRDIYLILIGAGISLASSILTLVLQFVLGLIRERIHLKREEKSRQLNEIRAALVDKSKPVSISDALDWSYRIFGRSVKVGEGLDLPAFLRRRKADGSPEPIIPVTPSQFWLSVYVGILVFLIWVVVTLVR